LLRPEAIRALKDSSLIIHAGDIGGPDILSALREIAPIVVVRGNNDRDAWAESIPETQTIKVGNHKIFAIHNLQEMRINPAENEISIVISGHSHRPKIERRNGVLYLNPGSAGPRRFSLPIAIARLLIRPQSARARILLLAK